jgi:abhydrolase domain-containing protein 6
MVVFTTALILLWSINAARAGNPNILKVEGREICYIDKGSGRTILLLHGLFANKEQWDPLAEKLSKDWRVIAPDLPGYGQSTILEFEDYSLKNQVRLISKFLEGLGVDRCHVAGSSMGGTIAALYARQNPAKALTLAFLGAPGGAVGYSLGLLSAIYRDKNPFIPLTPKAFDDELRFLFVKPPSFPSDFINTQVEVYKKDRSRFQSIFSIATIDMYEVSLNHLLVTSEQTLIIWGAMDRIFDVSGAHMLRNLIANSSLLVLDHAGHLPIIENPDEILKSYTGFIRDVEWKESRRHSGN